MGSPPLDSLGSRHRDNDPRPMAQQDSNLAASDRRRTRAEESWVEISSQPSSSSLNSMVANTSPPFLDERIPRPLITAHSTTAPPRSTSATGSSQDEYEESSSESDRVLSSSNEDLARDEEEDDDDNRTALGPRPVEVFTPQPNAFSHPPTSQAPRESYFPQVTSAPNSHIRSRPYLQRARERAMTTSYQPDHDAALRASLTTLLSCAAAVRPKPLSTSPINTDKSHDGQTQTHQRPPLTRPSTQPSTLRLIPESALPSHSKPLINTKSHATTSTQPAPSSSRRRSRSTSKDRDRDRDREARQSKKLRPTSAPCSSYDDYFISPTVAGWVISAGMVLVFSAISFSAGFAWGRDVGRAEAEFGLASTGVSGGSGGSCAREAIRSTGSGLRRLHWSAGTAVGA